MDCIGDMGAWIARNWADLGTFMFTDVVAWTAIVGNRLNRRLVDAELDPAITVSVQPDPHQFFLIELVIKNVGRCAARTITLCASPDVPVEPAEESSRLSEMAIFQSGIPFMAPSQEIRTFYGVYPQLQTDPITVDVSFDRDTTEQHRRTMSASFLIDVRQFEGLSEVGESPDLAAHPPRADLGRGDAHEHDPGACLALVARICARGPIARDRRANVAVR